MFTEKRRPAKALLTIAAGRMEEEPVESTRTDTQELTLAVQQATQKIAEASVLLEP